MKTFSAAHRCLLGLFVALGLLFFLQGKLLLKSSGNVSSPSGAIAEEMETQFNGLSLAIMSYMQIHDPLSLERIQSEGNEAGRLLNDLKAKASLEGTDGAYAQVEKAHENLRTATLDLLAADQLQMKNRETLNGSSEELMSILIARIEPSIKPSQVNSSARLREVLAAAAEAKNLTKASGSEGSSGESQSRFNKAVDTYARLSQTRPAMRWAEEAKALFGQCVSEAQAVAQSEQKTQNALNKYMQRRNVLDVVLQESHFIPAQGLLSGSFTQALSSGSLYLALMSLLLLAGVMLVIVSARRTESPFPRNALLQIRQCVEAATTGDISRVPDYGAEGDIGPLAQAVGRLISVLARSENLVYHLAALVESSGDAIISQTLDGNILSWNKGAQRIYGYSADEMKGQSISILSPYDSGQEMLRYLQGVGRGERILPFETLHRASNGRTIRAFVRISPILDSTRKVIGASFCAQELSETELLKPKSLEEKPIG